MDDNIANDNKQNGEHAYIDVVDENFATEVLESPLPVIVDFWAPWCGPCRMVAPIIEELAVELAGKVKIVKINVDESSKTSMQYGIMSIPTMLVFKNGEVKEQLVGAQSKEAMIKALGLDI